MLLMLRFTKLLAILLISSVVFITCTLGDNFGGGSNDPGFQGIPQINYANYTLSFDPNTDVNHSDFKTTVSGNQVNFSPSGVILSPDGRYLFISERGNNGDGVTSGDARDGSVSVMSRDVNTGVLTFLHRYSHGQTIGGVAIDLDAANRAAVSADGKYLYVPGRWGNTLMVFSINPASGALTPIEKLSFSGQVFSATLTPDGTHLLIPVFRNGLFVYDVDKSTGKLTHNSTVNFGLEPGNPYSSQANLVSYLEINSTGDHIYIISSSGWVAFLKRAVATGAVTIEDTYRNGTASGGTTISGLSTPQAIQLSHDEKTLYVGGYGDALVLFDVDSSTGALTFKKAIANGDTIKDKDGNDVTLTDLDLVIDIQESAGGNKLYVGSHGGNAILVFDRNTSTGDLTYNTKIKNDDHLVGVFSLFISPNGQYIYASIKGSSTKPGGIAILNYK